MLAITPSPLLLLLPLFAPLASAGRVHFSANTKTHHLATTHATLATSSAVIIPDSLSDSIASSLAASNIVGVQVAVVHGNDTQLKAWGNKTETGDALTTETLMNVGSCSKAFLVSAMAILIDDFANGRNVTALPAGVNTLDWTTKLKALIPEWKLKDAVASDNAGIHDILSHVTGLPRHDLSFDKTDSVLDVAGRMQFLDPLFELRQKWSYSNQMYGIASQIITAYSNMPYTQFVEERILKPADMLHTTYSPTIGAANGTQIFNADKRRIPNFITEESVPLIAGAGGIVSTSGDMVKWLQLLLNGGVVPSSNTTVIPAAGFKAMVEPYAAAAGYAIIVEGTLTTYAMGWGVSTYHDRPIILHDGSIPGVSAITVLLPGEVPIGLAIMINGSKKEAAITVIWKAIVDNLLGVSNSTLSKREVVRPIESRAVPDFITFSEFETRATPSLETLAGTYQNPGYGSNFTLCAVSSTNGNCAQVLSNFEQVQGSSFDTTSEVSLYASWPRFFASHIQLTALNGTSEGMFSFTAATLFPVGYGANSTPFSEVAAQTFGVFSVDASGKSGLGVLGLAGDGKAPVFFEKIE